MTDREKLVEILTEHLGVMVCQWISVKDRLPKKWEYVLALNEYDEGAQEPCIAFIDDRGWIAAGVIGCKITHWMPLQPPKEANHETD